MLYWRARHHEYTDTGSILHCSNRPVGRIRYCHVALSAHKRTSLIRLHSNLYPSAPPFHMSTIEVSFDDWHSNGTFAMRPAPISAGPVTLLKTRINLWGQCKIREGYGGQQDEGGTVIDASKCARQCFGTSRACIKIYATNKLACRHQRARPGGENDPPASSCRLCCF